jgi:GntR family transcriptional regulator
VLSGRLKAGDRLPTIRALAVELKINPNTIAKAYSELEIRGLLVKRTGSGTFICDQKPPGADEAREEKIRQIVGRFLREMGELGVERDAVIECIKAVPKFHFLEQPQKMKENIQHEKNEFGLYSKCAETQTE